MSASVSCGIRDDRAGVSLLATRIFDNVRLDLNRTPVSLSADLPDDAAPLYAGGTGVLSPAGLTVTPHFDVHRADVSGTLSLPGTLSFVTSGAAQQTSAALLLPFAAVMELPEDAVWPFDVSVHYSYFVDRLRREEDALAGLADGVCITYVTALVPLRVAYLGPVSFHAASSRSIDPVNTFVVNPFYPQPVSDASPLGAGSDY